MYFFDPNKNRINRSPQIEICMNQWRRYAVHRTRWEQMAEREKKLVKQNKTKNRMPA